MSDLPVRGTVGPATAPASSSDPARARRSLTGLDTLAGTTITGLVLLVVVSVWAVVAQFINPFSVLEYVAWTAVGGMLGLCVASIGALVGTITGDREWKVVTGAGLVFATFWCMLIALAVVL